MNTVVSYADEVGTYAQKMKRLEQSLKDTNFNGSFVGFNSTEILGCNPHKKIPYQFKPYAIKKASEHSDLVLWCDSVVYAKHNIQSIFDHISTHGYLFFDNIGFSLGDFTNDKTLDHFGISREEAWNIPMIMACVMGFDFKNDIVKELFKEYLDLSETLYKGEWDNRTLSESKDARVRGHRHDQSVMSALIWKYGLKITKAQDTFFAYEEHRKVMPIASTVCLFSAG